MSFHSLIQQFTHPHIHLTHSSFHLPIAPCLRSFIRIVRGRYSHEKENQSPMGCHLLPFRTITAKQNEPANKCWEGCGETGGLGTTGRVTRGHTHTYMLPVTSCDALHCPGDSARKKNHYQLQALDLEPLGLCAEETSLLCKMTQFQILRYSNTNWTKKCWMDQ